MKKWMVLLLVLFLFPALCACDETDSPKETGTTAASRTPILPNFDAIAAGKVNSDVIWGLQDETTKGIIIAAGAAEGLQISFGEDGSMLIYNPSNNTTMTQSAAGSWSMKLADGTENQSGGTWPDNAFTKLLPVPNLPLWFASTESEKFSAAFENVTVDQIRSYADQIRAYGFSLEPETVEENTNGRPAYSYRAKNRAGYTVTVSFTGGTGSVVLEKPMD